MTSHRPTQWNLFNTKTYRPTDFSLCYQDFTLCKVSHKFSARNRGIKLKPSLYYQGFCAIRLCVLQRFHCNIVEFIQSMSEGSKLNTSTKVSSPLKNCHNIIMYNILLVKLGLKQSLDSFLNVVLKWNMSLNSWLNEDQYKTKTALLKSHKKFNLSVSNVYIHLACQWQPGTIFSYCWSVLWSAAVGWHSTEPAEDVTDAASLWHWDSHPFFSPPAAPGYGPLTDQ